MTNTLNIYYVDEDGKKATHACHVAEAMVDPNDAAIETLVQAVAGVSNAGVSKMTILVDTPYVGLLGSGPYDASDKLTASFSDSIGNVTQLAIPAPNRTILEANDEEVDDGNALWQAFKTELVIFLVSKGGEALLKYLRSRRIKKN